MDRSLTTTDKDGCASLQASDLRVESDAEGS